MKFPIQRLHIILTTVSLLCGLSLPAFAQQIWSGTGRIVSGAAKCILAIANDASIIKPTTYERPKGGYGSKMMDAIASELPDGVWKMSALPDG
ncbi:hypothetical protein [Nostoc sp. ChiQUE01b]|uniref:hypothetical protein n=1 Tax=Nostoc sp. ChiQUE01b TaxID=3075376 RepID=UPI002AD45FC1|nr:hypothetical protein [Nostoc sp. ChiQUE01b]MDZ8263584.1 hypothetical protein [Nostoc sp. ChiQUE01b]